MRATIIALAIASLSLTACNNAPVTDATASETKTLATHNLGDFESADAVTDAALTHCTKTGFKGNYVGSQTITPPKGKAYKGTVMPKNPCATQGDAT